MWTGCGSEQNEKPFFSFSFSFLIACSFHLANMIHLRDSPTVFNILTLYLFTDTIFRLQQVIIPVCDIWNYFLDTHLCDSLNPSTDSRRSQPEEVLILFIKIYVRTNVLRQFKTKQGRSNFFYYYYFTASFCSYLCFRHIP